jgi:S1-C subfamily serine protease
MSEDTEQPGSETAPPSPAAADEPLAPGHEGSGPVSSGDGGPPPGAPGDTQPSPLPSWPPPSPPQHEASSEPSWVPHAYDRTEPTAATTMPFAYPPPHDPNAPGFGAAPPPAPVAETKSRVGRTRTWIPVVLVSALIGGLVGAGVTAIADNNNGNNGNVTVLHESSATPGAAVLSGNVTIPQLVNKVIPAVVSIDVKSNGNEDQGTGMIITANGEVITNNHVIELFTQGGNTGSITVTQYGQTKSEPATLIGYDTTKDVALLKINNVSNLPTVTFGNSSKAAVGDAVVAIGNALGLAAGTPTVTQGIVSALGRSVTAGGTGTETENLQNLIQTDAAINPGNSGGPLIDTSAQVIGMNTAVAGTSSDGTSSQNIGFAIPIDQVESLLPELQKGGQSGNGGGYLGVDITTLTAALRQQYGFTPTQGAVILSVVSGSPADKAGLVQGDVIVNINGTNIASAEDLQKVIQNAKPGQSVSITYYVGDSKRTTTATLGSQAQAQQAQPNTTNPLGGGGFPGFGNSGGTP